MSYADEPLHPGEISGKDPTREEILRVTEWWRQECFNWQEAFENAIGLQERMKSVAEDLDHEADKTSDPTEEKTLRFAANMVRSEL